MTSAIVPLCGHGTPSPSPDIGYLFPLFPCSQTEPYNWLELHPNKTLQHSWQKTVNFRDPQLPYAVTDTDALGSFSSSLSHRHAHHYVHSNTHTHTLLGTQALARIRCTEQLSGLQCSHARLLTDTDTGSFTLSHTHIDIHTCKNLASPRGVT